MDLNDFLLNASTVLNPSTVFLNLNRNKGGGEAEAARRRGSHDPVVSPGAQGE